MMTFLELAAVAFGLCVVVFVPFTFLMHRLLQRQSSPQLTSHDRDHVASK